jgi:uncharacterized protein YxjI
MRNSKIHILLILIIISFSILSYSQSITRGPYLTKASSTSIVIHFKTNIACLGKVNYGTSLQYGNSITELVADTMHIIEIAGLIPNTKYYYSVGSNLINIQGDNTNYFTTMPLANANSSTKINIWAVGDMSKGTQNEINMRDAFTNYIGTTNIHAWIMLGDNAYNAGLDDEYQTYFFNYFQDYVTKHIPLLPCLGNHDYANDLARMQDHNIPYFSIFTLPTQAECGGQASNTERYYSVDIGNIHCIQLDSYGLENVNGVYYPFFDTINSPQITWLKKDLDSNKLPWVIVSFHHPPYAMGTHNSDAELDLVAIREKVTPILERYNVDLVLSGHCHTYQRSNLIKNHTGLENTFDSVLHIKQFTTGHYDTSANSCAYIKNESKKDSGTIYMTIGSGSAYPQAPQTAWPHNAMSYSNWENNGSLLLTIESNRLDATWISTDTTNVVKDKFTMFKNVDKHTIITGIIGDIITLKASWKSNFYQWSIGGNSQIITYQIIADTIITVVDEFGCIKDTFEIKLAPLQIASIKKNNNYSVYPNPTSGKFTIDGLHDITTLTCYNLIGSLIFQENIPSGLQLKSFSFPTNTTNGIYKIVLLKKDGSVEQVNIELIRM